MYSFYIKINILFPLVDPSGRYYIGLWAVNCPCKDDPTDKVCNCITCKSDDVSETLKSKQMFESLMWKPNCSKLF